jgi:hypothetical protein
VVDDAVTIGTALTVRAGPVDMLYDAGRSVPQ